MSNNASARGHKAELALVAKFREQGYEVRRSAASKFPDLIVWDNDSFNLVEVKLRNNPVGLSEAKSLFKSSASKVIPPPQGHIVLALRHKRAWQVWSFEYVEPPFDKGSLIERPEIFPWLVK